jgi:hypothetical protein
MTITPSVFGAQDSLLALADTFLTPGSYSTLRSGLFGYVTTAMAQTAAEGVYHRNVLYRENFLNTASLPRSIYNFAKQYEYPVALATPGSCRALIGLYLDDARAAIGAQAGTLVLPRGLPVHLGSVPFVLAGEVQLKVFDGGQVTAAYTSSAMDFPAANAGTDYVRTYQVPQPTGTAGQTRLAVYMEVTLHQAVPSLTEFQIVSASATENTFFTVPVTTGQQLASFRVLYKAATDSAFTELETIFNEAAAPSTDKWCNYTFNGDGSLEVYFSPASGDFRPAYNSKLRVATMSTLGAAGNMTFTGVVTASLPSPFSGYPVLTELVTQPAGGVDRPSLLEIKRGIIKKLLLRDNIIIEQDLSNYLAQVVDTTRVYDSKVQFVKRQDDIQTRLFAGFLTADDASGLTVPTNTAALDLEVHDLETRSWSLAPGTIVIYDRGHGIYRLLQTGEYPDQMVSDPDSFVYCIPYLMRFRSVPFPHLTYYRTQANVDSPLTSGPGAVATSDSFLASSLSIVRNSVYDSAYTLDLPVNTNLSATALSAKCLVRLRFFDANTKVDLGYVEANPISGTNIFRAQVTSTDTFNDLGGLQLSSSLWNEVTGQLMALAGIPEDVIVTAELYYDTGDTSVLPSSVTRGGQVFQHVRSFTTSAPVSLYSNLDQVMTGRMSVTSAGTFHCDDVPLVGASYFLNPRLGGGALDIAGAYQDALSSAFSLLQNSTAVDVKFANTYGPSKAYTVGRVNLSLTLEVHPTGSATDALRLQIVQSVVDFIKACNDNPRGRFSLSNLTTHLETTIPSVSYLRFTSLNGVAMQGTQRMKTDTQLEQDNKRVPEVLNVAMLPSTTPEVSPFVPDVTVTFI